MCIRDRSGSQLIILCVPVGQMQAVTQKLKKIIEPGTTITDVGSVKLSVIEEIESNIESVGVSMFPLTPLLELKDRGLTQVTPDCLKAVGAY